ncbi:MAG: ROK family protein [Pyrinomonadaceae bacterium]
MSDIVLSADLGGTNLRMAAVSGSGDILARVKNRTPFESTSAEIVDLIVESVEACRKEVSGAKALVLAVPGTVNPSSGIITNAPNIPTLDDFDLAKAVSAITGLPVFLENDANAAAIGENWIGASRGALSSIMVTLGTGVGGGIIIGGEVIRGIDGTAGEIGHICVEPKGVKCGCGSHGCVEQYASATAIVRMAKEAYSAEVSNGSSNGNSFTSEYVFQRALEGDERAIRIFTDQGQYLGIMLAGLLNTLNPEVVVIGGGVAAAADMFLPSLVSEIKARAYVEPATRAKIVLAELGDNAGILGAAKLGFESSPVV